MASFFAIENKLPKNIMPNICMRIDRALEYFVILKKAFFINLRCIAYGALFIVINEYLLNFSYKTQHVLSHRS